jgi:transposase
MSYEIRADYNQRYLFPPSLEDLLPADHPARFIREFVDSLNLAELGFGVRGSEEGRPNYAADLLLKVWLYGFFEKIRSTRGLEKACRQHVGLMWLTGIHYPDHNSLWRFWRDNRKPLKQVFRKTIQVAMKAELVDMVLNAVDGTKLAAQSSTREMWKKQKLEKTAARLEELLTRVMREVDEGQEPGSEEYRLPEGLQEKVRLQQTIHAKLAELEKEERDQMHSGEPEAQVMKTSEGKKLGYNAQVVVDSKAAIIVAADVTTDQNDKFQLIPMIEAVTEAVGSTAQETVADSGYLSGEQLAKAEQRQTEVLVSLKELETQEQRGGEFHSSKFVYEKEKDCWICPLGEALTFEGVSKSSDKRYAVRTYRCRSFKQCPVRWQCSQEQYGRRLAVSPYYEAVLRQKEKQKGQQKSELIKKRMGIVEPIFAWIKQLMGFRRWTVRGLEKVKVQWALLCAVVNLSKMYPRWAAGQLNLT